MYILHQIPQYEKAVMKLLLYLNVFLTVNEINYRKFYEYTLVTVEYRYRTTYNSFRTRYCK